MAVTLDDKLVIGVSSRALFNLEEENKMLKRWRLLALQLQSEQDAIKKMVNYVPYPKDIYGLIY